jgi:hypothetical protein
MMHRILLLAASALRGVALPLLWIGSRASPVLRAARWCEDQAWGPLRFPPPETGRPAPTDPAGGWQ